MVIIFFLLFFFVGATQANDRVLQYVHVFTPVNLEQTSGIQSPINVTCDSALGRMSRTPASVASISPTCAFSSVLKKRDSSFFVYDASIPPYESCPSVYAAIFETVAKARATRNVSYLSKAIERLKNINWIEIGYKQGMEDADVVVLRKTVGCYIDEIANKKNCLKQHCDKKKDMKTRRTQQKKVTECQDPANMIPENDWVKVSQESLYTQQPRQISSYELIALERSNTATVQIEQSDDVAIGNCSVHAKKCVIC